MASLPPPLWGPCMWRTIHYVAMGYPQAPSVYEREMYRSFYVSLGQVMPCMTCAQGYQELVGVAGGGLDAALDSGRLFEWTVELHNAVNAKLDKPELSTSDVVRDLLKPPGATTIPVSPPLAVMLPAMFVGFLGALLVAWLIYIFFRRGCKK